MIRDDEYRQQLDRLSVLDGLVAAAERYAELLEIVASSPDADTARHRVAAAFGLTLIQATAVQDMQVRRFAGLERGRLILERDELRKQLA
jgi:DNA gyrase subunit A